MNQIASTCESRWLMPHPRLGIAMIDHLFNRLDGAYPNKWRAAFHGPEAIANWRESWAEAFDEDGITPEMVAIGLKACRKLYDWPPSLTEFEKACRPNLNVDAAIYEAIEQIRLRQQGKDVWSNPAFYWAAIRVGERDMLGQTFSQIKPLFERALEKVLAGVVQSVPERVARLEVPAKTAEELEKDRIRIDNITKRSYIAPNIKRGPGGNIGWAKAIVADYENGVKIPMNKLRIACQAIFNATGKEIAT